MARIRRLNVSKKDKKVIESLIGDTPEKIRATGDLVPGAKCPVVGYNICSCGDVFENKTWHLGGRGASM